MKQTANGFGTPDLGAARLNKRLVRPSALAIKADTSKSYEMAVLGRGMVMQPGAGVGWMQFRVVATPYPGCVAIGLVPADASVADDQYPGHGAGSGGWSGYGAVYWTLRCPTPPEAIVKFGQGDRVMLVLDCRAEPLLRLLVNSRPCLVHSLAAAPPATVCPAVALYGSSYDGAACVELEPASLPPSWDDPPS